jgi:hypothetical protein
LRDAQLGAFAGSEYCPFHHEQLVAPKMARPTLDDFLSPSAPAGQAFAGFLRGYADPRAAPVPQADPGGRRVSVFAAELEEKRPDASMVMAVRLRDYLFLLRALSTVRAHSSVSAPASAQLAALQRSRGGLQDEFAPVACRARAGHLAQVLAAGARARGQRSGFA